jgi:molybdate transport system permease protein
LLSLLISHLPDLSPLGVSLKVSCVATAIVFVGGTASAYGLRKYRGPGRSLLDSLLVAPLLLPPTIVGLGLLLLLGQQGPLGRWFGSGLVFTWYGAVVAAIVVAFPLMYRSALIAFEAIDPLLLEAARLDGASEWQVLRHLVLPLAGPGLGGGVVLTFARAFGEFGATVMVAGNIPGQTQTIPMALYFAVESGSLGEAKFWAIVALGLCFTVILVLNRFFWDLGRLS